MPTREKLTPRMRERHEATVAAAGKRRAKPKAAKKDTGAKPKAAKKDT